MPGQNGIVVEQRKFVRQWKHSICCWRKIGSRYLQFAYETLNLVERVKVYER